MPILHNQNSIGEDIKVPLLSTFGKSNLPLYANQVWDTKTNLINDYAKSADNKAYVGEIVSVVGTNKNSAVPSATSEFGTYMIDGVGGVHKLAFDESLISYRTEVNNALAGDLTPKSVTSEFIGSIKPFTRDTLTLTHEFGALKLGENGNHVINGLRDMTLEQFFVLALCGDIAPEILHNPSTSLKNPSVTFDEQTKQLNNNIIYVECGTEVTFKYNGFNFEDGKYSYGIDAAIDQNPEATGVELTSTIINIIKNNATNIAMTSSDSGSSKTIKMTDHGDSYKIRYSYEYSDGKTAASAAGKTDYDDKVFIKGSSGNIEYSEVKAYRNIFYTAFTSQPNFDTLTSNTVRSYSKQRIIGVTDDINEVELACKAGDIGFLIAVPKNLLSNNVTEEDVSYFDAFQNGYALYSSDLEYKKTLSVNGANNDTSTAIDYDIYSITFPNALKSEAQYKIYI